MEENSRHLGEAIHHNVFLHGQLQKEPLLLAAFRHQADACTNCVQWLVNGDGLAIEEGGDPPLFFHNNDAGPSIVTAQRHHVINIEAE